MTNRRLIRTKYPGVYRREADDRLVVRATAMNQRTAKMREIRRTLKPGATMADAVRLLLVLKREAAQVEERRIPDEDLPTVQAYAVVWGQRRLTKGHWSPTGGTPETVGYRLDRYIMPRLGDYIVGRLTYGDIVRWLDWMSGQVGRRTIRAVYGHLVSIDRESRRDYNRPAIQYPDAPPPPRREAEKPLTWENFDGVDGMALTRAQLATFLAVARELSPADWYPICLLGFATGARVSELLAAEAGDFDLDREVGIWLCRRHLVLVRGASEPGTKWNRRGQTVLIDDVSTQLLRPYFVGLRPIDLVFPSSQTGSRYRSTNGLQGFLNRVATQSGLRRMTTKVFRRTYQTLAHVRSIADAMAQAQAGHANPKTTMMYVKPSIDQRREHARSMADVLHDPADDRDE